MVYWTFNVRDEYYTPKILADSIVEYIPKDIETIWCPFDTKNSEIVFSLKEAGYTVIHSHIWEGKDFFEYEPKHYDAIISNPPYSIKKMVFDRLYSLGKPFAMVMGLPILNYQEIGTYFFDRQKEGRGLELIVVDKKVSFDSKCPSFNNSWFCYGFLEGRNMLFHQLKHSNQSKHYVGSRMYQDIPKEVVIEENETEMWI